MTADELDTLAALDAAATPGPWHVKFLDDVHLMNAAARSALPELPRLARVSLASQLERK